MKKIVVVDAQGGGFGKQIVLRIREALPESGIIAIGTNVIATQAMLKAGASRGATGENAVKVACKDADAIVGAIGIVIADAMMGEITPAMATAIGQSPARRILLPVSHCGNVIAGASEIPLSAIFDSMVTELKKI